MIVVINCKEKYEGIISILMMMFDYIGVYFHEFDVRDYWSKAKEYFTFPCIEEVVDMEVFHREADVIIPDRLGGIMFLEEMAKKILDKGENILYITDSIVAVECVRSVIHQVRSVEITADFESCMVKIGEIIEMDLTPIYELLMSGAL
jgi:hypothetical protein